MAKPRSRLSESLAPYLTDDSAGVTKLSISLPSALVEEVRRAARERGTSVSATIAAALQRALDEGSDGGSTRPPGTRRASGPAGESEVSGAAVAELARFRGASVGGLIDEALAEWLVKRGIRLSPVRDDEWRRRLEAFLERRRAVVERAGWTEEEIQADVDAAVTEVRESRAARRR